MRYSIYTLSASLSIALSQTPSLPELIQSQADLSLLADALTVVPEFASTLAQSRNVTILAPTNSAFEALLAQGLNAENQAISTRDPDGISTLIAYHVLKGTYLSTDFTQVPTYVNTELDQEFSIFGTIRSNVTDGQNVGLVLNGGNATIISGELQTSNVVQADITTIPGVTIHKIDKVLTIPLNLSDTLVRLPQVGVSGALGLLDTAGFIDRVDANGESDQITLDIVEDITVFIPNNEALISVASAFQGASNATLRSVLGYHAIQGAVVFASDLSNTTVESVQGEDLTLTVGQDGTVYVDNARVVFPNILLSNGVAHVIDQVLNPATPQINRTGLRPSGTPDAVYTGASRVGTAIPFTRSAITPSTVISIPPLATTARFVNAGGAANATTTGATASRSASPSQFTGAAARFNGGVGALFGLGAALVL